MKRRILELSIEMVEPHSISLKTWKKKDLAGLCFVIRHAGQLEAVKCVMRNGRYYIFDGVSRYYALISEGVKTIWIEEFDYTDEELGDQCVLRNYRTKRTLTEFCDQMELVLGILGSSQGKLRKTIGDLDLGDDDFALVGRDRFELAATIVGCEKSAPTVRKLLDVKRFVEQEDAEIKGLGLMEKLDNGSMKINQAFNIVQSYKTEKEEKGENSISESIEYVKGNHFQLFNRSCEDLSAIPDGSIDVCVYSNPYFKQRDYSDGKLPSSVIPHGEEPTVDEYVAKQLLILKGIYPKLKENGSIFIVMSDTFSGKHLLATQKLIIAADAERLHLAQEIAWEKENPSPQSVKNRLMPAYEKILHFVKNPDDYYFREFRHWKDGGVFSLIRSNSSAGKAVKKETGWSLKRPIVRFRNFLNEQFVKGIINSPVYHWDELKEIDPKFRHPAPFASYIPLLPILMCSKPGDTVLDVYSGTGTTAAVAVQLGRNAIGYDTDTKSHDFAVKRLTLVEENLPSIKDVSDFEREYMEEAA